MRIQEKVLLAFCLVVGLSGCQNDKYEVIERSQKEIKNYDGSGTHDEVLYVLLHDGHKFYAACDYQEIDKIEPAATCALRILKTYKCAQPTEKSPQKVMSDLTCVDDDGHPVYLYVNKKD